MKFCSQCRGDLTLKIPEGDTHKRQVCVDCGHVFYVNPRVIVCTLPVYNKNSVLLCKRAIEPAKDKWTLPGGFLEMNEVTAKGALRETYEEALLTPDLHRLYCVFEVPHIGQIYFIYWVNMVDQNFGVTSESTEVKLFHVDDIPWDELSFSAVRFTLRKFSEGYDADRESNVVHQGVYTPRK